MNFTYHRSELGQPSSELISENARPEKTGKALIDFASFHIESRCHLSCLHCHSRLDYWDKPPFNSSKNLIEIIRRLSPHVSRIQLTGGEVFMRRSPETGNCDVPLLAAEIARQGHETILQTTGMIFDEVAWAFIKSNGNTTWVGISIDGADDETSARLRQKPGTFSVVAKNIPRIKELGFKIKIGTCVTSIMNSVDDLRRIGEFLIDQSIDTWKLMQFYDYSVGRSSSTNRWLSVEDQLFDERVQAMHAMFGSKIKLVSHSYADFVRSPCLHVYPDGKLAANMGNDEKEIGNLFASDEDSLQKQLLTIADYVASNGTKTYR